MFNDQSAADSSVNCTVTFKVTTMTSNEDTVSGNEVNLHVGPVNGHESFPMPKVWSVKRLPILTKSAAPKCAVEKYDYLSDLYLPEIDNDDVMLLLGSDAPFAHIPLEVRAGSYNQPYAIRSSIGWAIRGPLGADTEMVTKSVSIGYHCVQEVPQRQLGRMWSMNLNGVSQTSDKNNDTSVEDIQSKTTLESNTSYEDGRDNAERSQSEVAKTAEMDRCKDDIFSSVVLDEAIPLAADLPLNQAKLHVTKRKRNEKRTVLIAKPEPEVSRVTFRAKRNAKLQELCRLKGDRIDPIIRTQDGEWIGWMKRPPDIQTLYNGRDGEKKLT